MTSSPTQGLALDESPFALDPTAIAWVESTHAGLTDAQRVAQLLLPMVRNDASTDTLAALARSGVGGAYRFANGDPTFLRDSAEILQRHTAVPLLLPADLEFEELTAIGGIGHGTRFPNQLAVAATGSTMSAERMAEVAATEAAVFGVNWSFTPVADISFNFRNPLVATRSFGDDVARVKGFVDAYVRRMEALGLVTTTKHFPGDGVDDRDQHTVPSRNSLSMGQWWETFGEVFRAAISAGTRTIMAGHISLPAYLHGKGGSLAPAYLPASLSRSLLNDLLRRELGFNGLIVSDASEMGGFGSLGRRDELVTACIEAGCDMLLFNEPGDHERLLRALEAGWLSRRRLDEASVRVLALKASLGLHQDRTRRPAALSPARLARHAQWADEVSRASVTLVRDTKSVLPISPQTHRRMLLAMQQNRRNVIRPLPDLEIGGLLRDAGFDVTILDRETVVDASRYDMLIYAIAEESKQGKIHLRIDWNDLQPGFPRYMSRHFHDLPCVLLSFGSPYLSYDAPQCPIIINAYSPVPTMQQAVVDALTGAIPFSGVSPVNALAGLDDGELIADTAVRHTPSDATPQPGSSSIGDDPEFS